jgi:hypothetical protein
MTFPDAFLTAQVAMGLTHYHVTFRERQDGNYATTEADPENCIATVYHDPERCRADGVTQATAAHECLHLALADLIHAHEGNSRLAGVEEERAVRRLESIVTKGIFGA